MAGIEQILGEMPKAEFTPEQMAEVRKSLDSPSLRETFIQKAFEDGVTTEHLAERLEVVIKNFPNEARKFNDVFVQKLCECEINTPSDVEHAEKIVDLLEQNGYDSSIIKSRVPHP